MIYFTEVQKNEFDKLKADEAKFTVLQAMVEVQNNEEDYPVLFLYLFGDNEVENQANFAHAWFGSDEITVEVKEYYLIVIPGQYISVDPDGNVSFTAKDDYSKQYQKKFTEIEIQSLQQNDYFNGKMNLSRLKVEVSVDDAKDTTTTTTTQKS